MTERRRTFCFAGTTAIPAAVTASGTIKFATSPALAITDAIKTAKERYLNMVVQLNPPIPIKTPNGKALAHVLIDYGPEYDLLWVVFQENGECWTWNNKDIRADENITFGRKTQTDTNGPRLA